MTGSLPPESGCPVRLRKYGLGDLNTAKNAED